MPSRIVAVVVVSFALGAVTTAIGLFAFTVPGRAIRSLQRENRLLHETVRTLEQERSEVQAILADDGEAR